MAIAPRSGLAWKHHIDIGGRYIEFLTPEGVYKISCLRLKHKGWVLLSKVWPRRLIVFFIVITPILFYSCL